MYGFGNNIFKPTAIVGRFMTVDSYEQIQTANIPMDGTPTLFMLTNDPVFYVVRMEMGQKMISGYNFTALEPPTSPAKDEAGINTLASRMDGLENALGDIKALLKEAKGNESTRTTATKSKSN